MMEVKLGEIASFSQGQQIPIPEQKTKWFEKSDIFLRIVNYTQKSEDFRYIPKQNSKYHVSEDDIIMVRYGAVGYVGRGLKGVLANNMFKISFDEKTINSDFLYRVLWSERIQKQLLNASQRTSMAAINFKTVARVKIPLPPLATQQKIAAILDETDKVRQLNKQLIDKYDALTQSLFLDMFGDPVNNPKGWEKVKFEETSKNLDSKRIPIKQSDREKIQGNYPYYGATGIVDYVNDYIFSGVYLLVAEDGKNLVNRKKPIAWTVNGDFWVNNHSHIVEFNGVTDLEYLGFHLNHMDISNYVTGIDQFKMNKSNLNRIPIMKPPLSLQNQFAERVQAIEQQKSQAQESLQKSQELFHSLLQRAFKGELVN